MPRHLQDHICYNINFNEPSSITRTLQKVSLGRSYPLANYVTCDKFCDAHKCCIPTITKIMEPRFYYKANNDANWQEAMAKEIEALRLNNL